MCDRCAAIFSENEENWSSAIGTQFYTDDRGRKQERQVQEDRCGNCNGTPQTLRPTLAIKRGDLGYTNPDILRMESETGIVEP